MCPKVCWLKKPLQKGSPLSKVLTWGQPTRSPQPGAYGPWWVTHSEASWALVSKPCAVLGPWWASSGNTMGVLCKTRGLWKPLLAPRNVVREATCVSCQRK